MIPFNNCLFQPYLHKLNRCSELDKEIVELWCVLMDQVMLMVGTRPVIIRMVPVLRVLQAKSIRARAHCPI